MSTSDQDALAEVLLAVDVTPAERAGMPFPASAYLIEANAGDLADAVLNSDWLAAREAEAGARALEEAAREWQFGGWTILTAPPPADSIPSLAFGQRVTDWLRARAADLRDGGEG